MQPKVTSVEVDLIDQQEVLRRASLSRHQLRYRLQKKLFPRPSGTSLGRPMWSGNVVDAFVGLLADDKPETVASGGSPRGKARFEPSRAACAPPALLSPQASETTVKPDLALNNAHATTWGRLVHIGKRTYSDFWNWMDRRDIA